MQAVGATRESPHKRQGKGQWWEPRGEAASFLLHPCTQLVHFVLDSPRWQQLLHTCMPSLTYLPAVCYSAPTYLPAMYFQPCRQAQILHVCCSPFLSHQSWCVLHALGGKVTLHRANSLPAPGKGSHMPGSPTQQTLQCPMGHAGRAGRMERANVPMKAWADLSLSLSAPKAPVSPSQGALGPLLSLSAVSQACTEKLGVSHKFSSVTVFVWTFGHLMHTLMHPLSPSPISPVFPSHLS